MTKRPPTTSRSDRAAADLIACTRQAEEVVRRLAPLTRQTAELTPADVDTVLSHLTATVDALPQVAGQLATTLGRTLDTHLLATDGMTATTDPDPDLAIDTARHHLDESRHPAVETSRRLNAAHNEVTRISVTDDLVDESWSGHRTVGDKRPRPENEEPACLGVVRAPGQSTPAR